MINSLKAPIVLAILITVFIFPWICLNTKAQPSIALEPAEKFNIPLDNGTISFAVNGTYSNATLENGTWTFVNLRLDGSPSIKNLEFSAQNSNVTILSYLTTNNTVFSSERLMYTVSGRGRQIVNLGIGPGESGLSVNAQWTVILTKNKRNTFVSEGNGWTISNDGAMDVSGETGNITVVHYDFSQSLGNISKLPFYLQHSVAIATAVAVASTIIIAVMVKVKSGKHLSESKLRPVLSSY